MAELDRLDREFGLGAMPSAASTRRRRDRRTRSPVLPGLVISTALVSGMVALSPTENMRSIRRLFGFDNDRLAAVPDVTVGVGSHSFLQTQRGRGEPVAYDPCRPIEVVVNPDGAPTNYDDMVDTGLKNVGAAAGLVFTRVGSTSNRSISTSGLGRRQPVLIMWATPEEVPDLAGDIAGLGGSVAAGTPGRMRYITGQVTLDLDLFATFDADDAQRAQAIVDHELGHLVGLGHVDDPGELMYEGPGQRTTWGPGDLEGLARLGSVDCW